MYNTPSASENTAPTQSSERQFAADEGVWFYSGSELATNPRTSIIGSEPMQRVDLYIKVTVDVEEDEKPERVAGEICRQLEKNYVVRAAELSSIVPRE